MRVSAIFVAATLALFASPAFAKGEASAEGRLSGVANGHGAGRLAGVGVGYDWDLNDSLIVGVQGTGEVSLQGDFGSVGVVGRIGPRLGSRGKLYALAGVAILPGFEDDRVYPVIGAGIEFGIGKKMFGKVEYRLYTNSNVPSGDEGNSGNLNQLTLGVGVRF